MPWLNLLAAREVLPAVQERIKVRAAVALAEVFAKEERGLFVTFARSDGFYRAGARVDDAAVIELRYIGTYGLEVKQAATRRLSTLLGEELGLDPQKVIVLFNEFVSEDWGRKQGAYS